MKKAILQPQFILSPDHVEFLSSLPAQLPDTKLTKKQVEKIGQLYYHYISKNGIFHGWGTELYKLELKEKWPSGPRVKTYEAQRMILGHLLSFKKTLTPGEAASFFFYSLTSRESYTFLISKVYTLKS